MSRPIELPDGIYEAIERYAKQHGQTAEMAIAAWGESLQQQVEQAEAKPQKPQPRPDAEGGQQPFDPWQGFLTEATSPDVTLRHDYYLGEDALDTHETE